MSLAGKYASAGDLGTRPPPPQGSSVSGSRGEQSNLVTDGVHASPAMSAVSPLRQPPLPSHGQQAVMATPHTISRIDVTTATHVMSEPSLLTASTGVAANAATTTTASSTPFHPFRQPALGVHHHHHHHHHHHLPPQSSSSLVVPHGVHAAPVPTTTGRTHATTHRSTPGKALGGINVRNAFRQYRLAESMYAHRDPPRTNPYRYYASQHDDDDDDDTSFVRNEPFLPEHVALGGYDEWVEGMEARLQVMQRNRRLPGQAA